MLFISSILLHVLASHVQVALGWGAAGHEIVATIAQIYLHPTAEARLCSILPTYAKCHLAPIAAWADKVRPYYRWSSHMHYIGDIKDHPRDHCAFGKNGWEDPDSNVLQAIWNTTTWIQDGNPGEEEALKFLVHFMGDLHMPLHLTGRDRGGNNVKVRFDGRITNLHSVWDSRMIAKSLRTLPLNYTKPLPISQVERSLRDTIYDPYIRQIMWEGVLGRWKNDLGEWLACPTLDNSMRRQGQTLFPPSEPIGGDNDVVCPFDWAKPIHELNCDIIWPAALDDRFSEAVLKGRYLELDTPQYYGLVKKRYILEQLLAMAGIRLAAVLNHLFAADAGSKIQVVS